MSKKKKNNDIKIEWVNHSINFISVLLGVIIAFSLNNWGESKKEHKIVNTALLNIKNELDKNLLNIDSIITSNQKQMDIINEYLTIMDEDLTYKLTQKERNDFENKYPGVLRDNDRINFEFDLYQLSDVAWSVAQQTGILSSTEYDLAFQLAETYDLQQKTNQMDTELINSIRNFKYDRITFHNLLSTVRIAQSFARKLKEEYYPKSITEIENRLTS